MRIAALALAALLGGCAGAEAVECLDGAELPHALSDTGCFEPGAPTEPVRGLAPYDVRVALWSDGADKRRYLGLPRGEALVPAGAGRMELPPGGVLVKAFAYGGVPIETRFLVRNEGGGWRAATYLWNDAGTEAFLFDGGTVERAGRAWDVPSRAECFDCHTEAAGTSLGLELGQLEDPGYAADDARAYLHVNCAHCHRPGAEGAGTFDLRYSTPERLMHLCNERPERGDPTGSDGVLIAPGAIERSVLYRRMATDDPRWRMPPLGTRTPDDAGLRAVRAWIESGRACPPE